MGTVCACGGGCALLVPFHGHSTGLRRWLCPRPAPPDTNITYPQKKCPDHIFPDPGTVHYQIINSLSLQRWHYRYTTGNICPSGR